MKKAIFWDNDGVLIDSEELYHQASHEALAQVGLSCSLDEFVRVSLGEGKSLLDKAAQAGLPEEKVRDLRRWRNQRYAELLVGVHERDGIESVLKKFKGRVTMAIVTASLKSHFLIIHEKTGFLKYFDFVLTDDDVDFGKPHPDPYLKAIHRSGFRADDCLVVEDSRRGLMSARAAGLECIAFPSHLTQHESFTEAVAVARTAEELGTILARFID